MIRHNYSKMLVLLGCLLLSLEGYAQRFSVQRFRQLPNDISAYIQPVKDLNDEACALLKVVGDRDFAFSTPLGIVKRINDVGEIWLYVPKGTVQITIKHPQWGVLRDYRFDDELESRLTYELVLSGPMTMRRRNIPPMKDQLPELKKDGIYPNHLPFVPGKKRKMPKELPSYLVMLDVSGHKEELAGGIRLGWMRRHGIYLHALSNFQSTSDTDGKMCDETGQLIGSDVTPYYTGQTENARSILLVGGLHRIYREFCLYEGIGYGQRTVTWETRNGHYVENKDYSYNGVSGEIGLLYRFPKCALSAGAITIEGKYWEWNIGIGFRF